MTYKLKFFDDALVEWAAQPKPVQDQLKKKLRKLMDNPHRPANRLHGLDGCYKIKLRAAGVRLVYRVVDDLLVVVVLAIGKRERNAVYDVAKERLGT